MLPIVLGALAGVANAASQVGNFVYNKRQNERTMAYNSPSAQVARLQSAGINPQGAVAQIAAQNQHQFNESNFDFGRSFSMASEVGNTVADARNKYQQYNKLAEEIRALQNQNMYTEATMQERIFDVGQLVYKHHLDNLLAQGRITEQEYINDLKSYEVEWQKYLAGQDSIYAVPLYYSEDGVDYVGHVYSPRALAERYKRRSAQLNSEWQEATQQDRIDYERYKASKVGSDSSWAFYHAAREGVAYAYEKATNLPFNNKSPWLNIVVGTLQRFASRAEENRGGLIRSFGALSGTQ